MPFQVEKAMKHRVVFLAGEEPALRTRALRALLTAASDAGDFDYEEFDGSSSDPMVWTSAVGTAPFLSDRRTAVVRHVLRADPEVVSLQGLPDYALLILVGDDEIGDDKKQQELKKVRSAWAKRTVEAGGLVEDFGGRIKVSSSEVQAEAAGLGKKISEKAAATLIEMTGASLSRAIDELEKLAIFVGDQAEIRDSDVRQAATPSREWKIFSLVDSVATARPAEALRQLRNLIGSQSKAEDAAMRNVLPQLSRTLRLLWQARLCLDAGCLPTGAPDSIKSLFPERNSLHNEHAFVQGKTMEMARAVSLEQLAGCFECLARADAKIKGLLDAFSAMDTLEQTVLDMVSIIGAKPASKRPAGQFG